MFSAKFISIIGLLLCLWGCASSQQQQGQQGTQQEVVNQAANQQGSLNGQNAAAEQGEAMNNAVEGEEPVNNFNSGTAALNQQAPLNNAALNTGLGENVPTDLGTNNMGLSQSTPVNNTLGANSGTAVPATNSAAVPTDVAPPATVAGGAAASTITNPHMNWPGKGRVKYVRRTITKHAQPNGQVVGQYEQGDHPLIYQDGNWVELSDGTYVQGSELSEKGIARPKKRRNE